MTGKIVALGDSLTYGYPYSSLESWVEHLRRYTGWEIINAGVSGDTFEDMLLRLSGDVLAHNPQLVMLMGGTNDVFQGMSQPQIQNSFLAITGILAEKGVSVMAGLPLPLDDFSEGALSLWRNWLEKYCWEKGIPVINFYGDFVDEDGKIREHLFLDGCHPKEKGYEIMGQRVINSLLQWGLIK